MRGLTVTAGIALGLLAAGCAGLGQKPAPAPVAAPPAAEAPVAGPEPTAQPLAQAPAKVRCVPHGFPKPPKYPDTDQALRDAGGAADRYQLMAAGRILRLRRLAELEKLLDACR